jgi:hypothetical protein
MAFVYRNGSKTMYVSIQISKDIHLWEDSLLYEPERANEPKAKVVEYKEVTIIDEPLIKGRLFIFIRPNSTLEEGVLYWFDSSRFKIDNTIKDRYVLISLWNYVATLKNNEMINNDTDIKEAYLSFAKPIALHWDDMTNSTINYLMLLVIIPIVASVIIFIFYKRKIIKG